MFLLRMPSGADRRFVDNWKPRRLSDYGRRWIMRGSIPHIREGEIMDSKVTLAEFSAFLGKLVKGLRKGHKAASGRDWRTATGYYRMASEVLSPGGPIQKRIEAEADRMAKLAADPPQPPKPLV